jgi:kynurenine formamidase
MQKYDDDSWKAENVWGTWGDEDEIGILNELTEDMVLSAFRMVQVGKVYDLETERFKGMPVWTGHCGFEILAYADSRGRHNMDRCDYAQEFSWTKPGAMLAPSINDMNMMVNSEILIAPLHAGTHIDALCHWSTGKDDHWYGGFTSEKYGTNFGPVRCDISKTLPMTMRGVLLDIAGYKGVPHLQPNTIITAEDCANCAEWESIELRRGDAVLIRTGERWPQSDFCPNAGLGISGARFLAEEKGAFAVGDDQICLEGFHANGSSSVVNHPQPVHHYLLIQRGIHILELLQLDELAADKCYEFCFICTPTKIRSATGMYVRPLAVV